MLPIGLGLRFRIRKWRHARTPLERRSSEKGPHQNLPISAEKDEALPRIGAQNSRGGGWGPRVTVRGDRRSVCAGGKNPCKTAELSAALRPSRDAGLQSC